MRDKRSSIFGYQRRCPSRLAPGRRPRVGRPEPNREPHEQLPGLLSPCYRRRAGTSARTLCPRCRLCPLCLSLRHLCGCLSAADDDNAHAALPNPTVPDAGQARYYDSSRRRRGQRLSMGRVVVVLSPSLSLCGGWWHAVASIVSTRRVSAPALSPPLPRVSVCLVRPVWFCALPSPAWGARRHVR